MHHMLGGNVLRGLDIAPLNGADERVDLLDALPLALFARERAGTQARGA